MKKLLLGLVVLSLLAVPAFAGDTFSLRGVTLSMNRQQVAKIESGVLANDENTPAVMDIYRLDEPVFGFGGANAFYCFTDSIMAPSLNLEEDRLYGLGIMFKPYALQNEQAVVDYRHVVTQLSDVYGEPVFLALWRMARLITNVTTKIFPAWLKVLMIPWLVAPFGVRKIFIFIWIFTITMPQTNN